MTEWRESDTFCECTIHRRANAPNCKSWNLALVKKDQLLITLRATEVWQLLSKLQKKSTPSTTGQMKGCIRHVISVFNSKTPSPHWASAAHQVSNRYTEQGTFHLDWDLPVKVLSMKALPKKMLYWYTKFTLKPTRYTARFTVCKNIKDPPSTVCHSQRWMVNPVFSYLKLQVGKTPFCQRNPHFGGFKKKISVAFALPIQLSLSHLTSSLTFPLLGGGGADLAARGLELAGWNQDSPFWQPAWGWKGLR